MRSIFDAPAFGSRGLPGYAPPALGAPRLAQAATSTPVTPSTPDQSDISGLTGGIEDLLKQLPPDVLGSYNAKYQQCQTQLETGGAVGLAAGGKCLVLLYEELKNFMKNGPPKRVPAAAPASEFPVLPAAFGVVGLLVLIWGLSKL